MLLKAGDLTLRKVLGLDVRVRLADSGVLVDGLWRARRSRLMVRHSRVGTSDSKQH